jgi:uncharacterized protein (TIGR03435 family)
MTELTGEFDYELAWARETAGGNIPRIGPPPDEIESHSTPVLSDSALPLLAAIQAQLGLRLEQRRGPFEVLIVDKVEKTPTEN